MKSKGKPTPNLNIVQQTLVSKFNNNIHKSLHRACG